MAVAAAIMSAQVKGAVKTQKDLGRLEGEFDKAGERAVGLAGMAVKARAQENLSGKILDVKTGHLRASVGSVVEKNGMDSSALVGTPVGYGAVHQFGSARNRAVKWLTKSLEESVTKVRAIFDGVFRKVR